MWECRLLGYGGRTLVLFSIRSPETLPAVFILASIHSVTVTYRISGFDENGYDRRGFDRQGLDKFGYDMEGYNLTGYNRAGEYDGIIDYDSRGYDAEGYNR